MWFYEEIKDRNGHITSFRYWCNGCDVMMGTAVSRKPVVLDLFAGAGGMSLGFKNAGFDGRYAVESDMLAAATQRYNFKEDNIVVFQQSVGEFLDREELPKVDHIHASPPCQGFSNAKQSVSRLQSLSANDRAKNDMILSFPKAFSKMKPATASMEMVKGIMSSQEKKDYLQKVVAEILRMGYQVRVDLLNAADFGDPQNRHRYILMAAKRDYSLPHAPKALYPRMTSQEALEHLEDIEPVSAGEHIKLHGIVINDHVLPNVNVPRNFMEYHLDADDVSPTVVCTNKMYHYAKNRCLTVRERARLQSFPDSFCFEGYIKDKMNQIGNAVPVRLAEAVATAIMAVYKP